MAPSIKDQIRSTSPQQGPVDIGLCSAVRIGCVSELGWKDPAVTIGDVTAAGGMGASQWKIAWSEGNGAGACNLVELSYADGTTRRFLLDCGWDPDYMAGRLAETGVDRMIRDGSVEFLYMSHEHMDHFFGLEAVLALRPDIPVVIPETFGPEAKELLAGRVPRGAKARNNSPHTGELIELAPGMVHTLMPGCASVTFDMPIILDTRGEQSFYCNMDQKGILAVTGCCHQGLKALLDTPAEVIAGGDKLHGIYGGLHIAPFGGLTDEQGAQLDALAARGLAKVAANHCTGLEAVEAMRAKGIPAEYGSPGENGDQPFPVAGDWVVF